MAYIGAPTIDIANGSRTLLRQVRRYVPQVREGRWNHLVHGGLMLAKGGNSGETAASSGFASNQANSGYTGGADKESGPGLRTRR
jgi:hypothetical protein